MLLSKLLPGLLLWAGCMACTATATTHPTVRAAEILEKISQQAPVFYENVTIEGDVDFTSLTAYPETVDSHKTAVESPIFFKNCVFAGKVLGFSQVNGHSVLCAFRKNLTFDSCRFNNEVNFQSVSVAGVACFSKCQFNRRASFEGAQCQSETYFDEVLFAQEARFQNATFERSVNFWKSVWADVAYFQGVVYRSNAQFSLTNFRKNVDFSLSQINGLLNFNYAQLTGRSSFTNCHFRDAVDFGNATLNDASFAESFFDVRATFSGASSEHLSFENAYFLSQKPALSLAKSASGQVNLKGARLAASVTIPIKL
ncbi:hypothetical protein GCM10028819_09800 [Spirosoma humi]